MLRPFPIKGQAAPGPSPVPKLRHIRRGSGSDWAASATKTSRTDLPIAPRNAEARSGSGLPVKRLKGFEPSTFCMATRPISETSGRRTCLLAGIS